MNDTSELKGKIEQVLLKNGISDNDIIANDLMDLFEMKLGDINYHYNYGGDYDDEDEGDYCMDDGA